MRDAVRERYGRVPQQDAGGCVPSSGCCGSSAPVDAAAWAVGYGRADTAAGLRPGEVVLDLGSGAGFDAFLAARAVGPTGRVIGVDMTAEMLQTARANLQKSGAARVEFRLGEIEPLPLADASVDVVLSNCVINLSPEKPRVFAEAFRVLRPGGRLAISDVVARGPLPAELRHDLDLYAGCIAGAAPIAELEAMLAAAGFADVRIRPKDELGDVVDGWFPGRGLAAHVASADITATKPA